VWRRATGLATVSHGRTTPGVDGHDPDRGADEGRLTPAMRGIEDAW
jgi:hypothetical protein